MRKWGGTCLILGLVGLSKLAAAPESLRVRSPEIRYEVTRNADELSLDHQGQMRKIPLKDCNRVEVAEFWEEHVKKKPPVHVLGERQNSLLRARVAPWDLAYRVSSLSVEHFVLRNSTLGRRLRELPDRFLALEGYSLRKCR